MTVATLSDKIAKKITISNNKDDIDILRFGIEGILSTVINTMIAIIISYWFGLLKEFILFNIVFIPIRCSHKSYHCSTLTRCVISSNIMMYVVTSIIHYIEISTFILAIIFIVLWPVHYYISFERNIKVHISIAVLATISILFSHIMAYCFVMALFISILLIIGRRSHDKKTKI